MINSLFDLVKVKMMLGDKSGGSAQRSFRLNHFSNDKPYAYSGGQNNFINRHNFLVS